MKVGSKRCVPAPAEICTVGQHVLHTSAAGPWRGCLERWSICLVELQLFYRCEHLLSTQSCRSFSPFSTANLRPWPSRPCLAANLSLPTPADPILRPPISLVARPSHHRRRVSIDFAAQSKLPPPLCSDSGRPSPLPVRAPLERPPRRARPLVLPTAARPRSPQLATRVRPALPQR